MSIFSSIRRARQHSKEEKAEAEKQKQPKAPYRHVVSHAAIDAISSAPPSWRKSDRTKIREENRKRHTYSSSGHNSGMPGFPRVHSGLSNVSYPISDASPMVRTPQTYSFHSGVSPFHSNVSYGPRDVPYSQPPSIKGKEVERGGFYYDVNRISPSSSKGGLAFESDSGTLDDGLEMKTSPTARTKDDHPPISFGQNHAHRLHPRSRRASDASVASLSRVPGPTTSPTNAQPQLHPRSSLDAYRSPNLPPSQYFDSQPATPGSQSFLLFSGRQNGSRTWRHKSSSSVPSLASTSTRPSLSMPMTPSNGASNASETSTPLHTDDFHFGFDNVLSGAKTSKPQSGKKLKKASKPVDRLDSGLDQFDFGLTN